jgi:hypothetical protein
MIVDKILNNQPKPHLIPTISDSVLVCKIELTLDEVKGILHSLGRTMCKGNELTISMELEDKLVDFLNHYH